MVRCYVENLAIAVKEVGHFSPAHAKRLGQHESIKKPRHLRQQIKGRIAQPRDRMSTRLLTRLSFYPVIELLLIITTINQRCVMDKTVAIEILRYYADAKQLRFDERYGGVLNLTSFPSGTSEKDPGFKLVVDAAMALGAEAVGSSSADSRLPMRVQVTNSARIVAQNLQLAGVDFEGARHVELPSNQRAR